MTTPETNKPHNVEEIPVSKLTIDHEVQRDLVPARVKSLAATLDLDAVGVLTVSRRPDGTMAVLDGQTRMMALITAGLDEWPVTCHVYCGLAQADEARLFRKLNNTRKATAFDDFDKGVKEGDPECVAILGIVRKYGLSVRKYGDDHVLSCVNALRKSYRMDEGKSLDMALNVGTEAWGGRYDSLVGDVINGLAIVFHTYGTEVDKPSLVRKLANFAGGGSGVLGQARAMKQFRSRAIPHLVAAAVVEIHNRKKTSGALPNL